MTLQWLKPDQASVDGQINPISNTGTDLDALRQHILVEGIPDEKLGEDSTKRSIAWKILLGVDTLDTEDYLHYVSLGPSAVHDKIRNDTFRTLATDVGFQDAVKEDMLLRLLDAFAWKSLSGDFVRLKEDHAAYTADSRFITGASDMDFTYIQGMNVLAAPFLYVMPSELEAFACFSCFISQCCPLYTRPTLDGVHRGLRLVDICLKTLDPELFEHFEAKELSAELYAFPAVLTFSAGTPPLEEALHLWDFLLAYGVHLNILCVVAQLHLARNTLLAEASPMKALRTFPPLEAKATIALCCRFVKQLPPDIYDKLARHPWDPTLEL